MKKSNFWSGFQNSMKIGFFLNDKMKSVQKSNFLACDEAQKRFFGKFKLGKTRFRLILNFACFFQKTPILNVDIQNENKFFLWFFRFFEKNKKSRKNRIFGAGFKIQWKLPFFWMKKIKSVQYWIFGRAKKFKKSNFFENWGFEKHAFAWF